MLEMISMRRSGDKRDERHDLFCGLLDATGEEAGGRVAISDCELMGKHRCLAPGMLDLDLIGYVRQYLHLSRR